MSQSAGVLVIFSAYEVSSSQSHTGVLAEVMGYFELQNLSHDFSKL